MSTTPTQQIPGTVSNSPVSVAESAEALIGSKRGHASSDAPPHKKSRPTPKDLLAKLRKHRKKERKTFDNILNYISSTYKECATIQNMIVCQKSASVDWREAILPHNKAIKDVLAKLDVFIGTEDMPKFMFREQARGPTGMRSAIVADKVMWALYTPPGRNILKDEKKNYEGENFDSGPFLTWGLPKYDDAFPRSALRQFKLVYIIEKDKRSSPVQHRMKGLYMCMRKVKTKHDRLYLVEWKHFLSKLSEGHGLNVPWWCKPE